MRRINHDMRVLERSSAVVTAASFKDDYNSEPHKGLGEPNDRDHREISIIVGSDTIQIARWGSNNLKPLYWLELLAESNINPQLLWTKVDFAVGEGLFTYREDLKYEEKSGQLRQVKVPVQTNPNLKRWLRNIKANQLSRSRATDYYFAGNCFNIFVPAREPEKYGIAFIDHLDASTMRCEKMNPSSRRVDNYWMSSYWQQPIYNPKDLANSNTRQYRAFRQRDPLKYARSVHHSKIYWPGQVYYGVQPWHAAHNWIGFANKIPVWMDANISNSYNIKFHIEYPDDYFNYIQSEKQEDIEAEKDRVFEEMDAWLAGQKNVSKTFFSTMKYDPLNGQAGSGWKITPVENKIHDTAFVDAYKASNNAMTSAWDVFPSLANIQREGKFTASGSEMRIAYQLHIALKVQAARSIMVEPIEMAYQINHDLGVKGFEDPELRFGFINKNVVTLAENPTGQMPTTEED